MKPNIKSITILWAEGSSKFDETKYTDFDTLQVVAKRIFREHQDAGGLGYNKMKLRIEWTDGTQIDIRCDISTHPGDWNPEKQSAHDAIRSVLSYEFRGVVAINGTMSF